jgi:ketosteroid isomerase-like protein
MSIPEDNVRLVQQIYASFTRRDIPAILAMLSDDVEWGEPENPHNPAGGTRRGHQGFLEWLQIGREAEDILALSMHKILADQDSVAVIGHMKCLAKPTGRTYESDFVHLVTLRSGKVIKFQEFFDTYAAGEAFRR